MGLLKQFSRLSQHWLGPARVDDPQVAVGRPHVCRFEEIETRRLMVADLHIAATYYDPASGLDTVPNVFQVEFDGGAAGTQLTHLRIDGSKDGGPLTFNDAIFDTAAGGLGAYGFSPLNIVSHQGFQVTSSKVVDGGTSLDLYFQGFQAGMKLVFTIDVDQVLFVDPQPGDVEVDAVDEGAEFQRSHLSADFTAPHYQDATTSTQFWDKYDANFTAANEASGTTLDLPPDKYSTTQDLSVLTAGAVSVTAQTALPDSISGVVYYDNNLDNQQEPGDAGIGGVSLTLFQLDGTQYVSTGQTAVTDAQGNYKFSNLLPGEYRVVKTPLVGYLGVGATAGSVGGQTRGEVISDDELSDIMLLGGDDSIGNDFAEALPNSISGNVSYLSNADTLPLAGVVLDLLDHTGTVAGTTTTDDSGNYRFGNLAAGTYTVVEQQPSGYLEGDDSVGSAGGTLDGPDKIGQIALTTAVNGTHYDFVEQLPTSIGGHVGLAVEGECGTPNTPPIAGVVIHLLDYLGAVVGTTTTDTAGNYSFGNLPPGTYGIQEVRPDGYLDADTHAGTAGGTVATDLVTDIVLASGVHADGYDFCELLPVSIGGHASVSTRSAAKRPTPTRCRRSRT